MEVCSPIACICDKIAALSVSAPDAVALSQGTETMTYGQLELASARVATFLREAGLVRGGTVAVCMERSFEWIISALGTMRAGATYVPLDHGWAKDRLRFAIQDSGATVVVAQASLLADLNLDVKGLDPVRDAAHLSGLDCSSLQSVRSRHPCLRDLHVGFDWSSEGS